MISHPGFPGVGQNHFQPILRTLDLWNLWGGIKPHHDQLGALAQTGLRRGPTEALGPPDDHQRASAQRPLGH